MRFEHGFRLEAGQVAEFLGQLLNSRDVVAGGGGEEIAVEVDEGGVEIAGGAKVEELNLQVVSKSGQLGEGGWSVPSCPPCSRGNSSSSDPSA